MTKGFPNGDIDCIESMVWKKCHWKDMDIAQLFSWEKNSFAFLSLDADTIDVVTNQSKENMAADNWILDHMRPGDAYMRHWLGHHWFRKWLVTFLGN